MKNLNKKNRNSLKLKGLMIVFLVSLAFSAVVFPSVSATSMWSKTYGGAAADTASGETVQASDGGYAILGETSSFGAGGSDFWLIKTDEDGNMQWNKTYGGALTETSGDMCLTSDGGYALSGLTRSFGAGGQDFWFVKVDAAGTMLWNKTYGGTGNEYAYHVIQTVDGGYALLGQTSSFGAGSNDFWLVKTDGSGNMQWNQTYGGTGNDQGLHLLQTGDGGYALSGSTTSFGAGGIDAWLIKTDAAGAMLWNETYGGTGTESGQCLAQTSDGGYAIACLTDSFGAGSFDFWLIKTDSNGNVQWNQTYGGTGSDGPLHFIPTSDGGYAMAGWTVGNSVDAGLLKTDSAGNLQWNMTYGGANIEISYALLETGDGGYLLTINTNSFGAGGNDIWLVKTDGAGEVADYSWEWPMFGHNPQRTGCTSSSAPSTNQTLWTADLGSGAVTSPAVADGKLFIGGVDRRVYCFDAATGVQLWNYTTGSMIYSSAAVADGRVFVGSNDNNLYCFDAASGALLWNYTEGDWAGSSPTVVDGRVFVGSDDNNTYCFDAVTGTLIWNYTTGGKVVSGPAVAYGRVYVGAVEENTYYCLDAATGAQIWNYTTGGEAWTTPAVADGRVYVGSFDNNTYCLDAMTGAQIWNYTTGGVQYGPHAVAYGKIYVGSNDDNVYCLDAETGALIWNYTTGDNAYGSPVVADGKVYATSNDGKVYCLNATDGALIWSYTTTSTMLYSCAAVANGVVYVATGPGDAQIIAFSDGGLPPIPESLTVGVMLLLSTIAVTVSIRYYRKRPKWENW